MENNKVYLGDNLEVLKTFPKNSIDSIVTDPPYGISFMNKKWDYDIPSIRLWREVMRVLKPGGHMLVACGTRTQHRMAYNIEEAGFEIRDIIAWVYGSGFPKSHDVSKAIDKTLGRTNNDELEFAQHIKMIRESHNITLKEFNNEFGYVAGCNWWESENHNNYRVPNQDDYKILVTKYGVSKKYQKIVDRWFPVGEKNHENLEY